MRILHKSNNNNQNPAKFIFIKEDDSAFPFSTSENKEKDLSLKIDSTDVDIKKVTESNILEELGGLKNYNEAFEVVKNVFRVIEEAKDKEIITQSLEVFFDRIKQIKKHREVKEKLDIFIKDFKGIFGEFCIELLISIVSENGKLYGKLNGGFPEYDRYMSVSAKGINYFEDLEKLEMRDRGIKVLLAILEKENNPKNIERIIEKIDHFV